MFSLQIAEIASDLYSYTMEAINYSMAKLMLGSHCLLQGIKSLDGFGERFSDLAFIVTTKWKLLLLILTIMYGIFRLLQKTCKWEGKTGGGGDTPDLK